MARKITLTAKQAEALREWWRYIDGCGFRMEPSHTLWHSLRPLFERPKKKKGKR